VKNSNLLDVLEEVAELSDADIEKFKKVLERTTLEQIIKLSDEVTRRLTFLNMLHEMTYGEVSRKIKERSQLHKVLEQHTWLFGDKFHLATSDKGFRKVVERHREQVGLPAIEWDELEKVDDFKKIPDLFFVASRSYPISPRNHHLIVELKAPSVKIGVDELAQIKKYANIVRNSAEFDKKLLGTCFSFLPKYPTMFSPTVHKLGVSLDWYCITTTFESGFSSGQRSLKKLARK
jgi:hypothetical protein